MSCARDANFFFNQSNNEDINCIFDKQITLYLWSSYMVNRFISFIRSGSSLHLSCFFVSQSHLLVSPPSPSCHHHGISRGQLIEECHNTWTHTHTLHGVTLESGDLDGEDSGGYVDKARIRAHDRHQLSFISEVVSERRSNYC